MHAEVTLQLPADLIDHIVDQVSERLDLAAPQPGSPFLSTKEAADYLCCTRQRIHDLLTAGKLSRLKEGRRTLVLRTELEALVQLDRRRRTR